MVPIEGLEDARIPEPFRRDHGLVDGFDDLGAWNRQAGRVEKSVGEALVGRDVDGDPRCSRRHRGPNALLVHALAELDERCRTEADIGNVAADGFVDQGLRRRPERLALRETNEALELAGVVEGNPRIVGGDEVVDEGDGHPAGLHADRFLAVLVDDVVLPRRTCGARLAMADVGAGEVLELQGDVLGHVARPRPVAEPGDEAAAPAEGAGVVLEGRHQGYERVDEPRNRVRRVPLQAAEIDEQPDDLLARPVVRSAEDAGLEDPKVRLRTSRGAFRLSPPGPRRTHRSGCPRWAGGYGLGHGISQNA